MNEYRKMFKDFVYIPESDPKNLDRMVTSVVKLLKLRGKIISFAESCTGGLLSELITSVSGSSNVYELGICTYANKMKQKYLNVPEAELKNFGAVSQEVALSMAIGLKKMSQADVCISVTGIAGPDGGTIDKPVGTVYAGFVFDEVKFVKLLKLSDLPNTSRENIRLNTAVAVYEIIEQLLMEDEPL